MNDNTALSEEVSPATHSIFIGPDGLRAGWSLLIFIVLMAASFSGVSAISRLLHLIPRKSAADAPVTPTFMYIAESLPFLATLLVTWIMSKIERRPNSVYGLGGNRKLPRFLAGLAWGVTCLTLLFLILWKTGLLVINSRLLFGSDIFRYGALWLVGFLLVGLLEEYVTRGYLQFTLTRGLTVLYQWAFETRHSKALGFWTSALIFSILFGLGHGKNPGESPIGLLAAGLASMVFCLSLWRTGSLWWAIGFHTSWDWAQSFLYGVADSGTMVQHHLLATHPFGKPLMSGGATGPEGSIYVLLILALVSLIILFTLPKERSSNE
ncbi:CPBP family intramembrane glutamic endopeptidase [Granulicella arctica]|uniref:CAAX prenyl protease 2/Lysostaphin resistance protein A-like domain-containing protein n=1 Tax=Granulicella arctica TaxID=940613 RepID=A0A7Y9PJP4_9BACT|nr:CPBP family intramembrane glutamic endopeptidase [Granulicella arctica]NYF81173.1 hypothetical protein [Granulicella arctica]